MSIGERNCYDANTVNPDAYRHLDAYVNNFSKTSSVSSELLWGDPKQIPAPWLSVIIPTFNRCELLQEALESALWQEPVRFSWEIIVVDNTPLDENGVTPALGMIEALGASRILYYHNRENIGSGYNWNRGAELARGIWISFLHDDDLLYRDALRNIERIILRKSRLKKPLGYIQARFDEFSSPEDRVHMVRKDKHYLLELTRFGTLITYYTRTGIPTCGTTILKRAYLEAGGINYDFGPTADAVLGYQIMRRYTVLLSDRTLGAYRWGSNETLKRETSQKLVYADYLLAEYCRRQSPFSRAWGKWFGQTQHNRNIEVKLRNVNRLETCATVKDFRVPIPYKKTSGFNLLFLRIFSRLYRESCRCKARWKAFWKI